VAADMEDVIGRAGVSLELLRSEGSPSLLRPESPAQRIELGIDAALPRPPLRFEVAVLGHGREEDSEDTRVREAPPGVDLALTKTGSDDYCLSYRMKGEDEIAWGAVVDLERVVVQ